MSGADDRGRAPRRGRPRLPDTDRRIIEAGRDLLRVEGPRAVNIDAVSAAAGVARTTVYRRYRSRDELVRAVLAEAVPAGLPAPDLPLPDKLRWVLERVQELIVGGIGRGGTAAVLTGADPAFAGALRAELRARLAELEGVVRADVEAGLVRADLDVDAVVGLLLGAYLGEVVRHREPRPDWADRTVALLADALEPASTGA